MTHDSTGHDAGPPRYPGAGEPARPGYPTYPGDGRPSDGPAPATRDNHLGVWALVLGLTGFLIFSILTGIPAIVVGMKARRAAAEGRATNGGLGTAGVVLGWLTVLSFLLTVAVVVWLVSSGRWDAFLQTLAEMETMGSTGDR